MISKFITKLKTILFKSAVSSEAPLNTLPGVGAKSAQALYEAGFKTKKAVIAADEKDLLAISGVGINLVKKLKKLK